MATSTETNHAGEFIVSEAKDYLSRDNVTVLTGTNFSVAGSVVELDTGKYVPLVAGSGNPVAVLYDAVDASGADVVGAVALTRIATLQESRLTYTGDVNLDAEKDAIKVILLSQNIKVV